MSEGKDFPPRHINRGNVTAFVAGVIATLALTSGLQSLASQHTKATDINPYQHIPADVIAMIEAAEVPFMNQDADGIGEFLTEDFRVVPGQRGWRATDRQGTR